MTNGCICYKIVTVILSHKSKVGYDEMRKEFANMSALENDWKDALSEEFHKEYYKNL